MSYVKTNWQNGVTPVNADNMNKIENGIANALAKPEAVLSSNELVGVGTNGEQVRVQLGEGLTLSGNTSPYTLSASGGSGGQLYIHSFEMTTSDGTFSFSIIIPYSDAISDLSSLGSYLHDYRVSALYYNGNSEYYVCDLRIGEYGIDMIYRDNTTFHEFDYELSQIINLVDDVRQLTFEE